MIVRNERNGDIGAITEITIAAFRNHPMSSHTEQFIINALRADGALTVSLVAEIDGQVVGHIAFSPVTVSDGTTGGMDSVQFLCYRIIRNRASGKHLLITGCLY